MHFLLLANNKDKEIQFIVDSKKKVGRKCVHFFEGKYEKVGIVWFEISISTSRSKRQGQWQGRNS